MPRRYRLSGPTCHAAPTRSAIGRLASTGSSRGDAEDAPTMDDGPDPSHPNIAGSQRGAEVQKAKSFNPLHSAWRSSRSAPGRETWRVAAIGNSVGEVAGAIRTMLGLTRRNRLRDHIRELADVHAKLLHADLAEARGHIASAITHQAAQLANAHTKGPRRLKWGPFVVGLVIAALAALPLYALWPLSAWWRSTLFVVDALVVLVLVAASISVLVEQESDAA